MRSVQHSNAKGRWTHEFFLSCSVPDVEADGTKVGEEVERVDLDTESSFMMLSDGDRALVKGVFTDVFLFKLATIKRIQDEPSSSGKVILTSNDALRRLTGYISS